jgi:hypothetical protein
MFKKLSDLDGIVVLAVLRKEPRREQVPPGMPEKSLQTVTSRYLLSLGWALFVL